jgi:hypothetical protein
MRTPDHLAAVERGRARSGERAAGSLGKEERDVRHRIELVSASIHWAHTEVVIELFVQATGGDGVEVEVTVASWGNYWDNRPEPHIARGRLTGRLDARADEHVITVDQPAPVSELRFDPRQPVVALLFGFAETPPMPAFCEPLMAWARSEGVDASRP